MNLTLDKVIGITTFRKIIMTLKPCMGSAVKNLPVSAGGLAQSLDQEDPLGQEDPLDQEDPLEKEIATHSSILAGKSQGQRGLTGYSPWGSWT